MVGVNGCCQSGTGDGGDGQGRGDAVGAVAPLQGPEPVPQHTDGDDDGHAEFNLAAVEVDGERDSGGGQKLPLGVHEPALGRLARGTQQGVNVRPQDLQVSRLWVCMSPFVWCWWC